MDALAARGNAADALRIYDRPCRLLREELGVTSGAAAQELHGRLLAQLDAVRPGG
jgi:hypothetical protein